MEDIELKSVNPHLKGGTLSPLVLPRVNDDPVERKGFGIGRGNARTSSARIASSRSKVSFFVFKACVM